MQPRRPKCPAMATARAAPSSGSVAEPSSSSSTSDCAVAVREMKSMLVTWAEKVERFGSIGGDRNSRLRHQCQQPHGFQGYCFSAGVGAGDDQLAAGAFQFDADRNY